MIRPAFDEWTWTRGHWIRYAYAKSGGKELLVVFNVYGGATTLEVLHLLSDGAAEVVFFIGSMYAKRLPIGTITIPVEAVDRAGIVLIDDPSLIAVRPEAACLDALREALESERIPYKEVRIASVPSVLHDIRHVREFVEGEEDIEGVEMEVSTFYHFSKRLGLKSYALLYVSDNPEYGIISRADGVRVARKRALQGLTTVTLKILTKAIQ